MRRFIRIFLSCIAILTGLVFLAWLNAPMLLAKVISNKTLVPVTIKRMDFDLNGFMIHDLVMDNPKGTKLKTALKTETIGVKSPFTSYFKSPIYIDLIEVNNVYVNIQLDNKEQTKGNWQTIMKSVKEDNKSPLSIERHTIIRKLIIKNIKVDLILQDGSYHKLSIDQLEFDNLETQKGIPTQEITEIIMEQMMDGIFLKFGLKIFTAPVEIIKGIFSFL